MNWVLIAAILFLAWNIAWGYSQGFLRIMYSLGKWIAIILVLVWLTPIIAVFLSTHTGMHQQIETKIESRLEEKLQEDSKDKPMHDQEIEALGIELPDAVVAKMPNLTALADGKLKENGVYETVAAELTDLAIMGIAGVFVLIIALIACHAVVTLFDIIERLPGIKQVNHGLGIVAGIIKGMILIWVLLALLATQAGTNVGQFFLPYIYEAPILEWLYENNFVISLWMVFF